MLIISTFIFIYCSLKHIHIWPFTFIYFVISPIVYYACPIIVHWLSVFIRNFHTYLLKIHLYHCSLDCSCNFYPIIQSLVIHSSYYFRKMCFLFYSLHTIFELVFNVKRIHNLIVLNQYALVCQNWKFFGVVL